MLRKECAKSSPFFVENASTFIINILRFSLPSKTLLPISGDHTKTLLPTSRDNTRKTCDTELRDGECITWKICKDSLKNGARINKDSGLLEEVSFLDNENNICIAGCDNDLDGCTNICKSAGYTKYFANKRSCVNDLKCANKTVSSKDCGTNVYCNNNSAVLDNLKMKLVDDAQNWTCNPPGDEDVWKNACQNNAKGTWIEKQKYCWITDVGCIDYKAKDTQNGTAKIDVYISSNSLKNNINISDDVLWKVTLTDGMKKLVYTSPSISMATDASCPDSCSPCAAIGMTIFLYSEGNNPDIVGSKSFGISIEAALIDDPTIIIARTDASTSAISISAETGSFSRPDLDPTAAKELVTNIETFENIGSTKGVSVLNSDVKQQIAKVGVPYESTPSGNAILIPCTEAFCTNESNIHKKFVAFAWKPISDDEIKAAGKTCNYTSPNIWYWVGKYNNLDNQVKQIYLQKGSVNLYILDDVEIGQTVTYQIAAIIVQDNDTPPDTSTGLGRIKCHSKMTTITVDVPPYTDKMCRNFLPEQVVGTVMGDNKPIPNYAWAQDGRCVWGGVNQESYQNYACLFGDVDKDSKPTTPDPSNFQLHNNNACATVIGFQDGTKPENYDSPVCRNNLASSCTEGSESGSINYSCYNTLGFSQSATQIDSGKFKEYIDGAMSVASQNNVDGGVLKTDDGRQLSFSNLVRNSCPPLTDTSCVDKDTGLLSNNCSSDWATITCDDKDTECLKILETAGVRDCKGDKSCVSNELGTWNCELNSTKYTCTQDRKKCFAFDKIENTPSTTCCAGNGYISRQDNNNFTCASVENGTGPSCVVEADGSSYAIVPGVWPQCSQYKPPPKPVCTTDQFYQVGTNSCVPRAQCDKDLTKYNGNSNTCSSLMCGDKPCCDGRQGKNTDCLAENCKKNCSSGNDPSAKKGFPYCVQGCDLSSYSECDPRRIAPMPNCLTNCNPTDAKPCLPEITRADFSRTWETTPWTYPGIPAKTASGTTTGKITTLSPPASQTIGSTATNGSVSLTDTCINVRTGGKMSFTLTNIKLTVQNATDYRLDSLKSGGNSTTYIIGTKTAIKDSTINIPLTLGQNWEYTDLYHKGILPKIRLYNSSYPNYTVTYTLEYESQGTCVWPIDSSSWAG